MMESEHEGNDTKMAETKNLEQSEESHENAGGDKITTSSALLNPIPCREQGQQNSRLFLSERSKLYEFSQSNRILIVILSSQSVNEESSIVHTLNPSIESADAEKLRVYEDIVKDYPDLIIETGRTETTISYKLHELVPFSIGLCKEIMVRDNSN